MVLAGVVLGGVWFYGFDAWRIEPARQVDMTSQEIVLRADFPSWETEQGSAVDGTINLAGQKYKVRLYMNSNCQLNPGDIVKTTAKLRLTDEGGSREPTYHRTNGILLLGYQDGDLTIQQGKPGFRDFPGILRQKSLDTIDRFIPMEAVGFAKALLLSDRSDMSYLHSSQFSVTGISHIVAVSGLHVTILFTLIYYFAGKRRYLTALIGIPSLILFAAMAGFAPSVTRASIMQILFMLALMLNREYDAPTALSFSALVMVLWNPLVIAAVGFQLSVGAVAGIFLFSGKIRNWLSRLIPAGKKKSVYHKIRSWVIGCISVTLSANIITLPLIAVYFGTVSLVAPITNLFVIPVVSCIFYGTALVCLLGNLFPAAAGVLGWAASLLIRYVFAVTDVLASFPLAAVYTRSIYIVFWLLFCYSILAILLCSKKRNPALGITLCTAGLAIAITASYAEVRHDNYRVTALDIGQGQCVLLQCNGETYMVDCGGSYGKDAGDYAARTLLSQGIFQIDGLILTHYDEDHIGGAEYLAQRVDIGTVYLPDTDGMDAFQQRLCQVRENMNFCPINRDMELAVGEGKITIFKPEQAATSNDSGAAVLFQREKYDTLITGDMSMVKERQLIRERELPDCEVLVVGHHGSKSSTSEELLYVIAPDVAMISAGLHNSHGHPSEEVLSRLLAYGCQILRTDLMGDIIYRG